MTIKTWISKHITYKRVLIVLTLISLLLLFVIITWPDKELHLNFFDVGQGDSIFIRTPNNYKILIDGGPDNTVLERLSSVLPFYDRQLDLMILTHPHADHINGLGHVLEAYQVEMVIYNPVPYDSDEYQGLKEKVRELGINVRTFTKGQIIELSDGVRITSYWPLKQETFAELEDANTASIVIRVDYGKFSALLTGDAEFSEVYQLEKIQWAPVTVLKVPHQGSKGSVTEKVLSMLQPELAVISVGDNKFGHPSAGEVKKLEATGAKVLRTDQQGTIEVVTNGKRWYYRSESWGRGIR